MLEVCYEFLCHVANIATAFSVMLGNSNSVFIRITIFPVVFQRELVFAFQRGHFQLQFPFLPKAKKR